MKIGIDIDGVLFPWTDVANEAVMERFGVPDPGPHVHWEHLRQMVTRDQWQWLWTQEGSNAVFGQVTRTYPGVVEAFTALLKSPERQCHFVTHRDPRRTAVHTALFLTYHFHAHPWAGAHVLQNSVPKYGLMEWDVFVDDKPDTVREMLAWTDAMVFAPARPWNEGLADLRTPRFIRYEDPMTVLRWVERHEAGVTP